MQSPVDINFMQTSFMSFEDLYFLGYGVDYPFVVENGGHAAYYQAGATYYKDAPDHLRSVDTFL
ncbi:hypothetical protein IscW_ISCW006362 [Ixodes scapularis]|uniref:Uncharacterized protein n=1 Tax=Ixodes scapularis TaxID=6945 RepID=B7PL11_IXOSC|nr:hypothetical protein IscW_ISCW006362 [Ixodes scapularis]|eukprot:XP_002434459.1 hypothetical protein IscW_ISCW006362 [Ixodes scapularis]